MPFSLNYRSEEEVASFMILRDISPRGFEFIKKNMVTFTLNFQGWTIKWLILKYWEIVKNLVT